MSTPLTLSFVLRDDVKGVVFTRQKKVVRWYRRRPESWPSEILTSTQGPETQWVTLRCVTPTRHLSRTTTTESTTPLLPFWLFVPLNWLCIRSVTGSETLESSLGLSMSVTQVLRVLEYPSVRESVIHASVSYVFVHYTTSPFRRHETYLSHLFEWLWHHHQSLPKGLLHSVSVSGQSPHPHPRPDRDSNLGFQCPFDLSSSTVSKTKWRKQHFTWRSFSWNFFSFTKVLDNKKRRNRSFDSTCLLQITLWKLRDTQLIN